MRLEKWKTGNLDALLNEGTAIQKRLTASIKHKKDSDQKAFTRLMLAGKLKQALGFINNNNDVKGVHTPTNEIQNILKAKHPKAEDQK